MIHLPHTPYRLYGHIYGYIYIESGSGENEELCENRRIYENKSTTVRSYKT